MIKKVYPRQAVNIAGCDLSDTCSVSNSHYRLDGDTFVNIDTRSRVHVKDAAPILLIKEIPDV